MVIITSNPDVIISNARPGKDMVTGLKMIEYDVGVKKVKPKLINAHIKILFPKNAEVD